MPSPGRTRRPTAGPRPASQSIGTNTQLPRPLAHQALLSHLLADGGPLVFAFDEFLPVVLSFLPRDEFAERGDVQDDAIVQIWVQVKARNLTKLLLEIPKLRQEIFLILNVTIDLLRYSTDV